MIVAIDFFGKSHTKKQTAVVFDTKCLFIYRLYYRHKNFYKSRRRGRIQQETRTRTTAAAAVEGLVVGATKRRAVKWRHFKLQQQADNNRCTATASTTYRHLKREGRHIISLTTCRPLLKVRPPHSIVRREQRKHKRPNKTQQRQQAAPVVQQYSLYSYVCSNTWRSHHVPGNRLTYLDFLLEALGWCIPGISGVGRSSFSFSPYYFCFCSFCQLFLDFSAASCKFVFSANTILNFFAIFLLFSVVS